MVAGRAATWTTLSELAKRPRVVDTETAPGASPEMVIETALTPSAATDVGLAATTRSGKAGEEVPEVLDPPQAASTAMAIRANSLSTRRAMGTSA
jgi:hypothetical protein